jgi:hypothetical protein
MYGQTRERFEFAWLPRRLSDGRLAWLRTVRITETFSRFTAVDSDIGPCSSHGWLPTSVTLLTFEGAP